MWTSDYKINITSALIITCEGSVSTHICGECPDLSQDSVDLAAESRNLLVLAHDVTVKVLKREIGANAVADLEPFD